MSGHVRVQVTDLRVSAHRVEGAATSVGRVAAADDLRSAAQGIPGADSVTGLKQVAQRWDEQLRSWRDTAREFSDALTTAAHAYTAGDRLGADAYAALAPTFDLVPEDSEAADLLTPTRTDRISTPSGDFPDLSVLQRDTR